MYGENGGNKMDNIAKMIINEECNGIEIYFAERPDDEILEELHSYKWRWHKKKRCWYSYDSDEHRNIAERLCAQYNGLSANVIDLYYEDDEYCYDDYEEYDFDPSEWDEESLLRKNGYTVSQEEGLSEGERQRILSMVIRNRVMTPYQVINHIERMVNLRDKQSRYDLACKKWRADMRFVMKEFC